MDDKELQHTIALAKTNNQKAFALFETHWDYVYGYLLKKLGMSLAEELTLNTLSKADGSIQIKLFL